MLSPRAGSIIKYVVGQYISRATPVSSLSLTNEYDLGVSPATIRNEMARLEEEGYITRPYSSAGSIPTDKGYRYYVDSLADIELPLAEQRLISHLFHQVEGELEQWLSLAATIIAKLVQNMALVTKPKPAGSQFKHLELIALYGLRALLVLVLRGARVKQQLITFDRFITQPELIAIASKLNEAYAGLTRARILAKGAGLSHAEKQITDCLLEIMQTEDEQDYDEPYLDGWHFMLSQPEFAHSQRIMRLMELVEHRNLLMMIVPQRLADYGVQVIIGGENKAEAIQDYSVVITQYGLPDEATGTVGVVGPTRMPYARVISTVAYLSSVLSTLVAELYDKESPAHPKDMTPVDDE
jgi:heat-inducible transcriptional repressor